MAEFVYILCSLTTLACAFLLLRGYGRTKRRLLLWSGLCFAGLTASNSLIYVDLVLLPDVNLYVFRLATAACSMSFLLYGLIWDSQ